MVKKFYLLLLLFPFVARANYNSKLETKSFVVKIYSSCLEGELVCNKVKYESLNKSNGHSLILKGETINRSCNAASCDLVGYQFENGAYKYIVYLSGKLIVVKNDQVIFSEKGSWE